MKKIHVLIGLVFVICIGLGFSFNTYAQENSIPSWIKNTAGFWVEGKISDSEFISALQFLVEKGILVIPEKDSLPVPNLNPVPTPVPIPIPAPTIDKSVSTDGLKPNLDAFYTQGTTNKIIVSFVNSAGATIKIQGDVYIKILDFDGDEIFSEKEYIVNDSFKEFTNIVASKTITGFEFSIPSSKIKSNNGLGMMKIIFNDSKQSYENEISLSHIPINEGFFNIKTGFINNVKVDKILDVGPFFVTVKEVGQYMGTEDGKPKEFFRANLITKSKNVSDITFKLDEMYIMDQNDKLYSPDGSSIGNLENVFTGKSYDYQGGKNGYALFEKIPSDTSKIKIILKLSVIKTDLSETPYQDELEISLK